MLPSGGGVVYTVTGTLPANTPPGTIGNTATVAGTALVPDLNLTNNSASATAPIVARAEIGIVKSGPATAQRGDTLTYSIVVTNNGPSDATNVLVTDPTPTDLTAPSLTGPCTVAPGCALAAGASQTVTAQFTVPPGYPLTSPDPIINIASVTSATTDLNPLNDTARANTALDAPGADISIAKTNNGSSVTAGQTTTYTLTVANAGPASAPNAQVVDTFDPAVYSNVTWSCAASGTASCAVTWTQTGNINTTLPNFPPGAANSVVFTVTATVLATAVGRAENTATVATAAGESDPDESNNTATDSDPITALVDVSITKTGPATIVAGTTGTYTIVVRNDGPSTALQIPVSDRVFDSAGVGRSGLISGFTAPAGVPCTVRPFVDGTTTILVRICDIPSLAVGGTATFTVEVTIPPDFAGDSIRNVAFVDTAAFLQEDVDTDDHTAEVMTAITREADVAVVKTGPSSVVAGSTVSYFLQVTNNGPSTATDVVLSDPLPAGLVLVATDGPCPTLPCTIPTLAPGEGSSTRYDVLIPPDYSGPPSFVNTATVQAATTDPVSANNSASLTTTVVPEQADVLMQKTAPAVVAAGGQIEYVVRIENLGPGPARNVVWSDVLPGGATLVSGTPPAAPTTCAPPTAGSPNFISCVTPLLDPFQTLEARFVIQANADLVLGSVLTNVATITSTTPDVNLANNRAELATTVVNAAEADVEVTKTDLADPVVAGSNVTYTIVARNNGPAMATNVGVTDTLPAGMTFVSATASQGSCAANTCSLGNLAAGDAATIIVIASTSTTGKFDNTVTVSATETDSVPANNTATEAMTVANATDADLEIQKVGPTVVAPGETTAYTILVTTRGPATALEVEVTDPLPAGVTFVANTEGCITTFPCEFEQLEPGQSVVIRTTVAIDSGVTAPVTLTNTASVQSAQTPDPDPANNSSTVTTQVYDLTQADVVIIKADSPDPVVGGTPLSYVITVENRGPATATAVVTSDTLPSGVTLVSAARRSGAAAVRPPSRVNWEICQRVPSRRLKASAPRRRPRRRPIR